MEKTKKTKKRGESFMKSNFEPRQREYYDGKWVTLQIENAMK